MAEPRNRFFINATDLQIDRGAREDARPRRPRDAGAGAVRAAENRRLLDPDTLQEDLTRAQSRYDRTSRRLAQLDPRSKAARRLEGQLGTLRATIESLAARLERLGLG